MSMLRMSEEQFAAITKRRLPPEPSAKPEPTKAVGDKWPIALRDRIVADGLPEPYREHVFHQTRGWRLDLAWPDKKLAVEVDGGVHRIKGRFLADIEKHNALVLAGWRHLRVTPRMVETGEARELVGKALEIVA